jgi:hypothetical protein
LRTSADLIGAILTTTLTQESSAKAKGGHILAALRRTRLVISATNCFKTLGRCPDAVPQEEKQYNLRPLQRVASLNPLLAYIRGCFRDVETHFSDKISVVRENIRGGNVQLPTRMPFYQCMVSFFGALITLVILSRLHEFFTTTTGQGIILGPFGALMVLQYGLTVAPSSQPRNALLGQAVALAIAIVCRHVVEIGDVPTWLCAPFATALSLAAMTSLGIIHPPAGASAAVFAAGGPDHPMRYISFQHFGNVIAIIMACLTNNLSEKSQHPIYWFGTPEKSFLLQARNSQLRRLLLSKDCNRETCQDEMTSQNHGKPTEYGSIV